MSQPQPRYMSEYEVSESAVRGNRIARKINRQPNCDAAIRYTLANKGRGAAIELARDLLHCGTAFAHDLVNRLERTSPNDIVSPHWE